MTFPSDVKTNILLQVISNDPWDGTQEVGPVHNQKIYFKSKLWTVVLIFDKIMNGPCRPTTAPPNTFRPIQSQRSITSPTSSHHHQLTSPRTDKPKLGGNTVSSHHQRSARISVSDLISDVRLELSIVMCWWQLLVQNTPGDRAVITGAPRAPAGRAAPPSPPPTAPPTAPPRTRQTSSSSPSRGGGRPSGPRNGRTASTRAA